MLCVRIIVGFAYRLHELAPAVNGGDEDREHFNPVGQHSYDECWIVRAARDCVYRSVASKTLSTHMFSMADGQSPLAEVSTA
ncbi:Amino acid transport protein [Rhodococcus sp. AW25M09]|nr:Amino acid transport protein [Rhodococcus sp. AW25M09]